MASAALDAVLDLNANPNAKASLFMRLVPMSTAHCGKAIPISGKCQNDLASVTPQLLPAGNHRGVQKCNFSNLPKLGNALQDPVGVEINIQKNFDLASCQNFQFMIKGLAHF